jgi:hypothetical protein
MDPNIPGVDGDQPSRTTQHTSEDLTTPERFAADERAEFSGMIQRYLAVMANLTVLALVFYLLRTLEVDPSAAQNTWVGIMGGFLAAAGLAFIIERTGLARHTPLTLWTGILGGVVIAGGILYRHELRSSLPLETVILVSATLLAFFLTLSGYGLFINWLALRAENQAPQPPS